MTHCTHRHLRVVPSRHRLTSPRRPPPIRATVSSDLVGLANICLDVHIPVATLPPRIPHWRRRFMMDFVNSPPSKAVYEPGGVCNTLIAAARLGLTTAAVGHVGNDIHGRICLECLKKEGVQYREGFDWNEGTNGEHPFLNETALCLVIVDPMRRHLFCSKFQINPGPVFVRPSSLKPSTVRHISDSKALFINGYAFQECSPSVLQHVLDIALHSSTVTFFDPGPYGVSLMTGSDEDRAALMSVIRRSNVVLATEEEATVLTRQTDPVVASRKLLESSPVVDWVVIKLGARGSLFLERGGRPMMTPGFEVEVQDTVGCGDSFAAAVVFGHLHGSGRSEGVMELANAVGAMTATGHGAGRNVAKIEDVQELLERTLNGRSMTNGGSGIDAALELLKAIEGRSKGTCKSSLYKHERHVRR